MNLLQEVKETTPQFAFVEDKQRQKMIAAYNRAIYCILRLQVNDASKPTAWCQQYDEITLQPAWAQAFEPPSISNGESAGVVLFPMDQKNPSKEIIEAVQDAVAWFRQSEILNTRVKKFRPNVWPCLSGFLLPIKW